MKAESKKFNRNEKVLEEYHHYNVGNNNNNINNNNIDSNNNDDNNYYYSYNNKKKYNNNNNDNDSNNNSNNKNRITDIDILDNNCPDLFRIIRGRLVILNNPIGRFHIISSKNEKNNSNINNEINLNMNNVRNVNHGNYKKKNNEINGQSDNKTKDVKNKEEKMNLDTPQHEFQYEGNEVEKEVVVEERNMNIVAANFQNKNNNEKNFNEKSQVSEKLKKKVDWKNENLKIKLKNNVAVENVFNDYNCEILSTISSANEGTFSGNVIVDGKVLYSSQKHTVHFGVRNNSYFIGYVNFSDENLNVRGTYIRQLFF